MLVCISVFVHFMPLLYIWHIFHTESKCAVTGYQSAISHFQPTVLPGVIFTL